MRVVCQDIGWKTGYAFLVWLVQSPSLLPNLGLLVHSITLLVLLLLLLPRHGNLEGALQLRLRVVLGLHPEISS